MNEDIRFDDIPTPPLSPLLLLLLPLLLPLLLIPPPFCGGGGGGSGDCCCGGSLRIVTCGTRRATSRSGSMAVRMSIGGATAAAR